MPMLSSALPPYTGPYQVGVIDVEVPVEPRNVGKSVFKDSGKAPFELETVLFTLYYPTNPDARSEKPKHLWAPKPLALHAEGYARFARINNFLTNNLFTFGLWMLAGSTEIPALADVPIYSSSFVSSSESSFHDQPVRRTQRATSRDDEESSIGSSRDKDPAFPVMVFSHGMASSRTDYTAYVGELASRGYVVAAIEHRDGSGPGSVVMGKEADRNVFHISAEQLERDPAIDTAELKEEQLAFRQAEVEETMKVLRRINAGDGKRVWDANKRGEGAGLAAWHARLRTDSFVVAGHSYGATLALQTLRPALALPIRAAIVLDPGKSSGPLNADVNVPTLVVHSNSWSSSHSVFFGRPHFDVVAELVRGINARGKPAWFMTSLGTTHPSVTDAPLIEPLLLSWTTGSTIDVKEGVEQYVRVSEEFMRFTEDGEKRGVLGEGVMSETYDHSLVERMRESMKGEHGVERYWQVHVAPK